MLIAARTFYTEQRDPSLYLREVQRCFLLRCSWDLEKFSTSSARDSHMEWLLSLTDAAVLKDNFASQYHYSFNLELLNVTDESWRHLRNDLVEDCQRDVFHSFLLLHLIGGYRASSTWLEYAGQIRADLLTAGKEDPLFPLYIPLLESPALATIRQYCVTFTSPKSSLLPIGQYSLAFTGRYTLNFATIQCPFTVSVQRTAKNPNSVKISLTSTSFTDDIHYLISDGISLKSMQSSTKSYISKMLQSWQQITICQLLKRTRIHFVIMQLSADGIQVLIDEVIPSSADVNVLKDVLPLVNKQVRGILS